MTPSIQAGVLSGVYIRGEVFRKAYDKIYGEITTDGKIYKYNNDSTEKQGALGCFNAYFGMSLWRSRPNLTPALKHWLPASGRDQGDFYGNWKQFSLLEEVPKDLGERVPELLSVQRKPFLGGSIIREVEVASNMDYMLDRFSWIVGDRKKFSTRQKLFSEDDREAMMQYVKDCLCVVMSEEFLRKNFTNQTVDRLLEYRQKTIDKSSNGRELRIRYDVAP